MSYQVLAGNDLTGEKYMVTLNTSLGSIELALDVKMPPIRSQTSLNTLKEEITMELYFIELFLIL